jgi:putative ubiquitin-RnfH superfamily antitoxin RatB of RatAB toxin-antitoxin module
MPTEGQLRESRKMAEIVADLCGDPEENRRRREAEAESERRLREMFDRLIEVPTHAA